MGMKRTIAGLYVHKDSIYLCVIWHVGAIIFERTYRVLPPDFRQTCQNMIECGVTLAVGKSENYAELCCVVDKQKRKCEDS